MDNPIHNHKDSDGVTCNVCDKVLSSFSSLYEHRRIHTGDRPHVCQICNKRFVQKAHLMIHRRTHTGEKPYTCNICHKRFAQSSHLKNHKRIHTGEKAYLCSICNQGFNQKPRLEKHMAEHFKGYGNLSPNSHFRGVSGNNVDIKQEVEMENSLNTDVNFIPVKHENRADCDEGVRNDDILGRNPSMKDASFCQNRRKPAVVRHVRRHDSDVDEYKDDSLDNDTVKDVEFSGVVDVDNTVVSSLDLNLEHDVDRLIDGKIVDHTIDNQVTSTELRTHSGSEDLDRLSNASESNYSSDAGTPAAISSQTTAMFGYNSRTIRSRYFGPREGIQNTSLSYNKPAASSPFIITNNRVCLVDFTTDDLLTHMMSRDDVHKCEFCCVIFQDQAMYHLHRSMHDKFDIRACNLCGKVSHDKHDFIAHFLSEHK